MSVAKRQLKIKTVTSGAYFLGMATSCRNNETHDHPE
jgi:hypothetical protein